MTAQAKMSKIEKELQAATRVKHVTSGKDKQTRQEYLRRLTEIASDALSDEAWRNLSPPVQLWVNAAAASYKANEEIADFQPDPENVSAPPPPPPARPSPKPAAARTPAAAATATTEAAAPKRGGALVAIKQIMIADPGISTADLKAKLVQRGLAPSDLTISSIRSDFRHSLRVLAEAGKLTGINLGA